MAFGSFDNICSRVALPLCSAIGSTSENSYFTKGVLPQCYARSVELANTMIFQIGNAFVNFGGLIVILIVIFNVRAKYTAIGRTEMLFFLYLVIGLIVSTLVVDCGVAPPLSETFAYFVSVQLGFTSAVCICLLYNGILYFQFWEDGTAKSMWLLRLICFGWFVVNFLISIITFKGWNTALDDRSTTALFVVSFVINAAILFFYVVSQVILVVFALDSYWPLGAIISGVIFFVAGQILAYVVNDVICRGAKHYIDGLFFASLCNVFTFMMIYKFWDMITSDDLEFSVANVEQGVNQFANEDEKRSSVFFN